MAGEALHSNLVSVSSVSSVKQEHRHLPSRGNWDNVHEALSMVSDSTKFSWPSAYGLAINYLGHFNYINEQKYFLLLI